MTDEGTPAGPTAPQAPRTDDDPIEAASADVADSEPAMASAAPTAPRAPGAAMTAWSKLDRTSQLVAGGSIAVVVIAILGLPIGAWDSTDFVLIVLVAAVIAAAAAWLGSGSARAMPIPLSAIELGAGAVIGVLAIWNVIEILFDLDQDGRGGVLGWVLAAGLAIAGTVVLVGAFRRNGGLRAVLMTGDLWTRIAVIGLALVLVGWALNLSVGYWNMSAATLTLAVLTLAAVIIVISRQVEIPVPAAWAGVVLGVFAAILAVSQWSELARLGDTRVDLSIIDILAFLIYLFGLGLIVLGGVLTALDQGATKPAGDEASPAG